MTREEMLYWLEKGAPAICLSAQKWRDIQEELAEQIKLNVTLPESIPIDFEADNCALCETIGCRTCIISAALMAPMCLGTPFEAFADHFDNCDENSMQGMKEAANAEIEMLEYLEKLEYPHIRPSDRREKETDGQFKTFQWEKDFTWTNEKIDVWLKSFRIEIKTK